MADTSPPNEQLQSTTEQLEKQNYRIKQLEKQNRMLQKKFQRSEVNRKKLEDYYENQSSVFNSAIQEMEKARTSAENRQKELEQALKDLQLMQEKLVESEKMSAVGVLMAGIAHEINNPITFIDANLIHAQNYVDDLLDVFRCYQEVYPEPDERITELLEEKDLDFVVQDIGELLTSMSIGSDRILNIVSGLKNFSRFDHAGFKSADLHEGIDSTLMILQHRLKMKVNNTTISLAKNYGEIPQVSCFAGQINQVFMNILSNAIDAIEERLEIMPSSNQKEFTGHIKIETSRVDEQLVQVSISDNGIGMSPETQQKLFNPFYTTKCVGKGTGLGMSISYKIIKENHHGKIYCSSICDEGTQFIIQLPIEQMKAKDNSLSLDL